MLAARASQRPLWQIWTSSFVSTTDDPVVRDPQCECARSLDLYWRTQRVIREHRDIQGTLFHAGRITDGASRRTLIEAAAERVAAGEDLFAVRCGLTIDLARRGMGQVLLPTVFDPRLWEAVDSRDPRRIAAYLDACETLYIPAVDGVTR